MAEQTDKVVGQIYQSHDYQKFSVLTENRGHAHAKGIKEKKVKSLQRLVDSGRWIHATSRIMVNEKFEIIDGAHTLEICRRNGLPVLYEIIQDDHFNEVPKREKIGNIYNINSTCTSWSPGELFNAAIQTKAPVALIMHEIIEDHENYFLWTDLMALLDKDTNFFMGRWRTADMKTFERKDLIEQMQSMDFLLELKYFAKFNLKARIAFRKGWLLKAAYDILWHARDMVDPRLFRKSLASIPEASITSTRTHTDEGCRRMLIQYYNKSQGQKVEVSTVLYALKHKGMEEEVIEL